MALLTSIDVLSKTSANYYAYTLLLKATRLLDWAIKIFSADDNKIFTGGGKANKTIVNLSN